jgi:hypothetical protein
LEHGIAFGTAALELLTWPSMASVSGLHNKAAVTNDAVTNDVRKMMLPKM